MRYFTLIFVLHSSVFFAQTVKQKLDKATKELLNSDEAFSANLSFYVSDDKGNTVYEYQGNKGLTIASTQKIFSAAMALELLGKDYQWKTSASYSGKIDNDILDGNLFIFSNGDPTLGSWRYEGFKPEDFRNQLISSIKNKGIKKINGDLIIDDSYFDFQTTPGGWPWNDIGNYYGAGVWGINWRENQFDINMNGKEIKNFNINLQDIKWVNDLKTAGTSDRSLIYTAPHSNVGHINGSLPAKNITISGATPNPPLQLGIEIKDWFAQNQIEWSGNIITNSQRRIKGKELMKYPEKNTFLEYKSPTLDKIIYWFLRKSINFYGETLVKTIAKERKGEGNFETGIEILKNFWKEKGIDVNMINFADGSGLSPQNYVSSKAEVQALLYTKKQPWFNEFYYGFPTQNNKMKMKSGTMAFTKSYAGYHTSSDGKQYVYSIIINNYQGNNVSEALFKVLNILK